MSWMREVRANDSLPSSRKTVAWALATYHNSRNGWTFPSLRTLARDCRIAPGTVIDAYRDLEAAGHLEHVERWEAGGRRSHQYVLRLQGEAGAGGVFRSSQQGCSDPANTPVQIQATELTQANDKAERPGAAPEAAPTAAEPEPAPPPPPAPPLPPESAAPPPAPPPISAGQLDRLARRAQQLANGRGWRLDNARAAVGRAVNRAGSDAVDRLVSKLEDGDRLPAWAIQARLGDLRRADTVVAPSGRTAGPQDAAWKAAEAMYREMAGGGVVDFSARMRVQKAVHAAGVADLRWQDRLNAVAGIATAIRAGILDPDEV
jgi:Helix-turn-helix domain